EAVTDDAGVVDDGALVESAIALVFAHNDRELTRWIAEDRSSVDAFDVVEEEWATCPSIAKKSLLLSNAVRVPSHESSLRLYRAPIRDGAAIHARLQGPRIDCRLR